MSSEATNFSAAFDVPSVRHPWICPRKQGLDAIIKDHCETGRFSCHGTTGLGLSEFPNYDIILVVASRKNFAVIGAKLGASKVGAAAHEIIVLLR